MNLLVRTGEDWKKILNLVKYFSYCNHIVLIRPHVIQNFNWFFCNYFLFLDLSLQYLSTNSFQRRFCNLKTFFSAYLVVNFINFNAFSTVEKFNTWFLIIYSTASPSWQVNPLYWIFFIQSSNYMLQLCKNIWTDKIGQIFMELSGSLFFSH